VSRTVEKLLEVALGLEPSLEIVRIGDLGGPVAQPGMSAALARKRYFENGLTKEAQIENEPLSKDIFSESF
ncbi:hypothetical protein, partial [Thermococcus sp. MV5]|uniref:hypothetical protein n=1 Tax=Thermococcus sp. MV5 TaxID=1638272 RepID=UPI00143BA8E6